MGLPGIAAVVNVGHGSGDSEERRAGRGTTNNEILFQRHGPRAGPSHAGLHPESTVRIRDPEVLRS